MTGGKVILSKPITGDDMSRSLALAVGRSLPVTTTYDVKRVSVGNPNVLDVMVLNKRDLQLVAKGVGVTNVLVWDDSNHLQALIDVEVGTATSHIATEVRRVLQNEQIELDSVGDSVVLRGTVSSASAMEQALAVTRAFLPTDERDHVVNLLEVGGGHQVMLEVVIAEMSRELRRNLGTNFAAEIANGGDTFTFYNFLGNLTSLSEDGSLINVSGGVSLIAKAVGVGSGDYTFFFELLERQGLGKVLAEPTLVARSGETARFLVGGEVPIPIAQGGAFGSITIEYKDFGVGLSFTPTVLSPDRIHLQVSPEVSEPSFAFGTTVEGTAIPSFNTRRASTAVDLGDGQSFAIAGLLRDDVTESIDKYPLLGDIPVLGTLFRSTRFQKKETELVIIVTPRIVKPLPPGARPLPTDHFIEPSAFEFYLLGRLEGRETEGVSKTTDVSDSAAVQGGFIGDVGHRIPSVVNNEMEGSVSNAQ